MAKKTHTHKETLDLPCPLLPTPVKAEGERLGRCSRTGWLLPEGADALASWNFIKQGPGHSPEDAAEAAASRGTDEDRRGLPGPRGPGLRHSGDRPICHRPEASGPAQTQPIPALTSKAESALRVLVRWPLSLGGTMLLPGFPRSASAEVEVQRGSCFLPPGLEQIASGCSGEEPKVRGHRRTGKGKAL